MRPQEDPDVVWGQYWNGSLRTKCQYEGLDWFISG